MTQTQRDDPNAWMRPSGFIQTTTAWQSVPKFVRFAVWVYAIATVISVAVVVGGAALFMLAAVSS